MPASAPRALALAIGLLALSALAGAAAAQARDDEVAGEGFLFRATGNLTLPAGERTGGLMIVDGHADVAGEAGAVIVINGTATLQSGGRAATLVVIDGSARLEPGSTVTGEVRLIDATLDRADGATVGGPVVYGWNAAAISSFLVILGLIFTIGVTIAVLVGALIAAAAIPRQLRAAGAAMTRDLGASLIAAVLLWIVLPIIAILLFPTVVGIPLGFAILAIVLPVLWLFGYVVAGVRLGEALVYRNRTAPAHPYLAAVVGVLLLQVVSWIPFVGSLIAFLAGALGSGAIAVLAWRNATFERRAARGAPVRTAPP